MELVIVIVEAEESLRERLRGVLREQGHRVWAFAQPAGAVQALAENTVEPDLAFLSARDDTTMDLLLDRLRQCAARCQRIWITPPDEESTDRFAASRRPRGLLSRREVESEARLIADRVCRTRERGRALSGAPRMLGDSEAMQTIRDLIERIATSSAQTVLVTGESGTGKDVTARRLHGIGPRAHGPFVEVDCASIPANLLESELFGHEPGAFTDARTGKIGLLELAQGGTAFLDEIGELPLGLQAKLLRVLDTRRLRRLGGRTEIPLDVCLVAATNRDLEAEVRRGAFRADLFYRLDVVRLHLPSIRERREDAWTLACTFLEEAGRKLGRGRLTIDPALQLEVMQYSWPGNVREIRNQMERLALHAEPDSCVSDLQLPESHARTGGIQVDFSGGPMAWEEIERVVLTEAMTAAQGNVSEAARLLGLGRGALRYRLSRHQLDSDISGDETREAA